MHKETFTVGEFEIELVVLILENAISIYVYEDNPKLGTVGLSVPGSDLVPPSTAFLTGMKYEFFVRSIGERLAKLTNKMALISVNITTETLFEPIWEKVKEKVMKT